MLPTEIVAAIGTGHGLVRLTAATMPTVATTTIALAFATLGAATVLAAILTDAVTGAWVPPSSDVGTNHVRALLAFGAVLAVLGGLIGLRE